VHVLTSCKQEFNQEVWYRILPCSDCFCTVYFKKKCRRRTNTFASQLTDWQTRNKSAFMKRKVASLPLKKTSMLQKLEETIAKYEITARTGLKQHENSFCCCSARQVNLPSMVFWVVTPCGLVGRYQRFGDTYCLHLQGWSDRLYIVLSSQRGTIFLRNVGIYLKVNTALQPRRPTPISSPPWEPQISQVIFFLDLGKIIYKWGICSIIEVRTGEI
jgi:hypothetical protein